MANSSDILDKLKKMREGLSASKLQPDVLAVLTNKLDLILQIVVNLQLKDQLRDLQPPVAASVPATAAKPEEISLKEKIERLKDVGTSRTENEKLCFVLHRPTVDFEYENGVDGQDFVTKEDTEWIADFEESTALRSGTNPVIAVWVGEDDIKDVPNAFSSVNDQFGNLGTNTSKNKYRVIVRAGKYPIYQELKKANKNSLFVLTKSLKHKLQKSDQYTKLDPKLLELKNSDKGLSSNNINAERAEQQLTGGKLDPKDIDKIIENRNQELNNFLLQREDLTSDHLNRMISHKDDFEQSHRHARTSEGKGMHKLMLMGLKERNPNYTDEMVKKGNKNAIWRLFNHSPNHANGGNIMDLVTKRHDLDESTMSKVFEHPDFDSGHGIELLKHPNTEVINSGLSRLNRKEKLDSNVLAAGLAHKNPEVVKHLIKDGEFPLNDQQVNGLLQHPNDEIKAEAAGRAWTPEQVDHILNNLQKNPEHKNIFKNLIERNNLDWKSRHSDNDELKLKAPQADRITDYAMAHNPQLLENSAFWNHDISPESMKKIATSSLPLSGKEQMFGHANLNPDVIQTLLNADKHPELMKRVARSGTSTPEQITQAWNQMDKKKRNSKGYGSSARKVGDFSEWIQNENTPPEIINHMVENQKKYALDDQDVKQLYIDKRLDPKHLNSILSHESPDIRKLAAFNPAATPEQIMHGLQDKDKDVRSKFLARQDLQPAHLAMALKDRAPSNRAEVVKHGNMTPELLHQVMTKDKSEEVRKNAIQHPSVSHDTLKHAVLNDTSEGVRTAALKHPSASKELIDMAINNPTADHATQLVDRTDLSSDQITKLSQALKQRYNDIEKERKDKNYRADWDLKGEQGKLTDAMYKYMVKPNIDQNFKDHFLTTADPEILQHVIEADGTVSPAVLEHAHNLDKELQGKSGKGGKYYHGELGEAVLRNANTPKTGIFNKIINEGSDEDHDKLVKLAKDKLSPEQQKTLIQKTNSENVLHGVAASNKLTPEIEDILYNKNKKSDDTDRYGDSRGDLIHRAMARNSSISPEMMEKFSAHANPAVRRELLNNTSIPEHIIDRHLRDADESVKSVAGDAVAHVRPDIFNASLDGAHDIHLHPATEKLKHLKGLVQDKGGTVAKKDLPQQYQNLGQLFDGKGNMTEQTIDKYLHDLPKHKYNVSYGKWDSSLQTHDDGASGPQKVLQVNLTNDHVKQLKEQGLYDTFRKLHEMSFRSGHPVHKHSLGWARIDESHPDHWHIDEIQSDLGQGTIRQIEKAKQSGDMGEEEADKYTNDLKGIMKTLSGPFKNINHAISGAVHESGRQKGIKSTSMDKLEDQAQQSGMSTDKNLPGHMINTYKQVPEDIGYAEKPKKEAMPNTTAPEPSLQFRKLVKSYGAFKFLAKYVEDSE